MSVKEKAVDSTISLGNIVNPYEKIFVGSTMPGEAVFPYKERPGEFVMKNGDASVVLGKDNPGQSEGYYGQTNAASIDLVVGRYGDTGKKYVKQLRQGTGNRNSPRAAENNYKLDAARIVISQKTDIDDNLYISDIMSERGSLDAPAKNKSGIGMKADNVRIVSRESIKLVAQADVFGSKDRRVLGEYGIDLIGAGTSKKGNTDLQPIVKGANTVAALRDLVEYVAHLDTCISAIHKMILQMESKFTGHFHIAPLTGPTTPPSDPASFAKTLQTGVDLTMATVEINSRQFNHAAFVNNYLTPGARSYICSPHNKTT